MSFISFYAYVKKQSKKESEEDTNKIIRKGPFFYDY